MILLAYNHALRASEVVSIVADDIDQGSLTVARLKGSLKTTQPLLEHADPLFSERAPLLEIAHNQRPNQRLFPITRERFWQIVKEHSAAAGLPKRKSHPHALKHTLCVNAIKVCGIEQVRQYAGHKSLSSTGAYLRVSDEEASAAVVKALGAV